MVGFLVRAAVRMLALAALMYVVFFVPIGPHTLYRHTTRIASTREARELWTALTASAVRAHQQFRTWDEQAGEGRATLTPARSHAER